MPRRKKTAPEAVTAARVSWLVSQISGCGKDRNGARKAGNWSAVAAFRRQEQSLRGELDQERLRLAEAIEEASTPNLADRTPEQVTEAETAHARELADIHLQLYVARYLDLHAAQGIHLATPQGPISLSKATG